MLAQTISQHFSNQSQEEFWPAYLKGDTDGFCIVVERVKWSILNNERDPRGKELLGDALDYALRFPSSLLPSSRSKLDSPNIVAFTLLIHSLQKLAEENLRIEKFVHDLQSQFGAALKEVYDLNKRFRFSGKPLAWLTDFSRDDSFNCPIQLKSSSEVIGLQFVDIVLWLVTRSFGRGLSRGYPNSEALVRTVRERAIVSELSQQQLLEDSQLSYLYIQSLPLSENQLREGQEIREEIEEARKRRARDAFKRLPESTV